VAQESKNPQRDLPIGIMGSLGLCTALYIAVSAVITGMVKYTEIDINAPIGMAFTSVSLPGLAVVIDLGALAGLTSVLLNCLIAQPRIFQVFNYLNTVYGKRWSAPFYLFQNSF
jgi:APA family basic amino acid/polyamine antiporter